MECCWDREGCVCSELQGQTPRGLEKISHTLCYKNIVPENMDAAMQKVTPAPWLYGWGVGAGTKYTVHHSDEGLADLEKKKKKIE